MLKINRKTKMTELLLVGDIHGKWTQYTALLEQNPTDRSIQIGDFGWGFPYRQTAEANLTSRLASIPGDHKYFRGNHDNPYACSQHDRCLADSHWEPDTGIMVAAGASSIDVDLRTPGLDWWAEEELSYIELDKIITLYEERKPRIMLTHDGPESVIPYMFSWYHHDFRSRTRDAFDAMLSLHQPEYWVFGHWHKNREHIHGSTKFICLGELQCMGIDV